MLPMFVETIADGCDISADAHVECAVLAEQVHFRDVAETRHLLGAFLISLCEERAVYAAAQGRHDHAGMAESAAEMRDLIALAGVCSDHLRAVGLR